jgi:Clp amino terminal domain, pathogenicity island component
MFNLNQAIAEWRKQMAASGINLPEALDELESHLREDVDQQVRSGLDEQQAFEKAVQQIGQADALKTEFKKIGGVASALQKKLQTISEQVVFVLTCLRMKWAFRAKLNALHAGLNVPLPSLDDFNASAKQSLALAHEGAHQFHHDFIGTEHVLLGLLQLEQGAMPNVLRRLRVDHQTVRTEIEKIVHFGSDQLTTHDLPYTPRVRKALTFAAREAKALNYTGVGAEHVFLGLLLEGGGVAALVLKNLGVQIERTREEILKELSTNPGAG